MSRICRFQCWTTLSLLIGASAALTGCTSRYQPLPRFEARYYAESRKDIFPDDVRHDPDKYAKTLVAWTGVLRSIDRSRDERSPVAYLTVEHHYFDWLDDRSVQQAHFLLSPRGEGSFRIAWRVDGATAEKFIQQFHVGDMVVAYGYPATVREGVIGFFPTMNLRSIPPPLFRTDVLEYGRPGETAKIMKTPL